MTRDEAEKIAAAIAGVKITLDFWARHRIADQLNLQGLGWLFFIGGDAGVGIEKVVEGEPPPMQFRQYIPAFVSGYEPRTVTVRTVEDILALDFVKAWQDWPGFHQFSMERNGKRERSLIAEFKGGETWRVVGFLPAYENIPLPTWARS